MKRQYILVFLIVLLGSGFFIFKTVVQPELQSRTINATVPVLINYPEMSFTFTYPSGEEGYTMIEPPLPPSTADGLEKVFILMATQEYITFQSTSTEDMTTPPTVTIFVVNPPEDDTEGDRMTKLQAWAKQNPQYSSFLSQTTLPEVVEIDGVQSVTYGTAGSYKQKVYLMQYDKKNYVFVGQYEEEGDSITQMFNDLISSVTFD